MRLFLSDATADDWTGGLVGQPSQRLADPDAPDTAPTVRIRSLDPAWELSGSFADQEGAAGGQE